MNFFFGIKNEFLNSEIKIPRFQNNGFKSQKYFLHSAIPKNNKWQIDKVFCNFDDDFYYVDFSNFDKDHIFFLAKENEITNYRRFSSNLLRSFNNFTKTSPIEFRSNLSISIKNKGFSSYQSEYSLEMSQKDGSVLSPLSTLLDQNSEKNILFFKNIFFKPIFEKSKLYIVDIKKKKVINEFNIFKNQTNEIEIKKEFIQKNYYIFSEKIIGIPLFVSINNGHISFEHTHPPHLFLLNENRYKKVAKLKMEIKSIVNQDFKKYEI